MKPKNKWYIPVAVFFLLTVCMKSGITQDKVGTSAAPFLGINIGAAATAMGGAYVSMANDASALYWNPGAISRLGKTQVNFAHTSWFVGTQYNWAGLVMNLNGGNAVGVNLGILDYGDEEVTTVHDPDGTGERWSAQDLYAAVSYARSLTDRFSIGGSVKIIQQKIYHESATGYALDVGLLYITRFNGMRLGMSITNFGTDMRMEGKDLVHPYDQDPSHLGNNSTIGSELRTASWPLPLFYRVGASMNIFKAGESALLIATDAMIPSDNSTILNVGGEFNWNQIFFLRAGYKSLMRPDTEEGLTAGLGIKYFFPSLGQVSFEYAYNDYGILQQIHTYGIGISF